MSNTLKFTQKNIERLPLPSKRIKYRDAVLPGLLLDVTSQGAKTFRYRRQIDGEEHMVTIGSFPEWSVDAARDKAKELGFKLSTGELQREWALQRAADMTLVELFDDFVTDFEEKIKRGERKTKSLDDIKGNWKNHVEMVLGDRSLTQIDDDDACSFLSSVAKRNGSNVHNKCLTVLKSLFNFAIAHKLLSHNPYHSIGKMPENKRQRFAKPHEMKSLLDSVEQEPRIYQDVFFMLLFTGQRKGNVLAMRWEDVDLVNNVWIIPCSETKNKSTHAVPLIEEVQAILHRRHSEAHSNGFVFASELSQSGHVVDRSAKTGFWRRVTERAGLYHEEKSKRLTVHDIRRTVASWQACNDESLTVIAKTLGHKDVKTTFDSYAHLSTGVVRASLERTTSKMLTAGGRNQREFTVEEKLINFIQSLSADAQFELWGRLNVSVAGKNSQPRTSIAIE